MNAAWTVEPARADDLAAAFRLVFRHSPLEEQAARLRNALDMVGQGSLDPRGIFVARGRSGLRGALVCTPVPGAGGLVWPPQVSEGEGAAALEDALIQHALAWLHRRGVKLTQSLLAAHEEPLAASLLRNGFAH